jgi:hypothetical protein
VTDHLVDGTVVTIDPNVAITSGKGVAAADKGVPQTYALSKGQVIQFMEREELAGSPLQSNKPIGVWGGMNTRIDLMRHNFEKQGNCDNGHVLALVRESWRGWEVRWAHKSPRGWSRAARGYGFPARSLASTSDKGRRRW